jgi:hypothetical protein
MGSGESAEWHIVESVTSEDMRKTRFIQWEIGNPNHFHKTKPAANAGEWFRLFAPL